jgi:hypothetical protein
MCFPSFCFCSVIDSVHGVSWGQDMLQLKCQHRYPKELSTDLSTPLEERLISLYQPCGWITKFQIDLDKGMSGRYRRFKKGV